MRLRRAISCLLFLSASASAQETGNLFPILLGRPSTLIAPSANGAGSAVVFGSTVTPEGAFLSTMDVYAAASDGTGLRRLTRLAGPSGPAQGATAVSLSPDGRWATFSALGTTGRGEEIHLLDVARATEKTIAVDTQGCIQPLVPECIACFFACLHTPHVTADGAAVLYAARRQQPFYVARDDGAPPRNLPVFSGILAASPQRVLSRAGQVVFTSSAPFGPTFAAAATNVYLMNLDGANVRPVTQFSDASVFARDATISADGAVIAFLANLDPATGRASSMVRLFTIRSDGSLLRQVPTAPDSFASLSISGDGSRLTFVAQGDVFAAASDGSAAQRLTNFRFSTAGNAIISEDGRRIVFTIGPPPAGAQGGGIGAIYAINSDGSGRSIAYAPRALNPGGVTGAAQAFGAVVAGSLISAFGLNFTNDSFTLAGSLPLPESLAGVSLTLDGAPLPLLSVGPWQINAQVPPEQSAGPAAFELRFADGSRSAPIAQTIQAFGPAIFLLDLPQGGGFQRGAVFHAGTAVAVDSEHPAQPGEALELYVSGLGPTNPFVPAGTPAPVNPPATTLAQPQVTVGRWPARVLYSGLAPGYVGLYQVNVEVPPNAPPGLAVPLVLAVAGMNSNPVSIAVR